ncbi:hypothetical protein FJR38_15405 [Anabaena sp. UHCC 0253]|uniref:hypothetical protein n=1 Tax=Anabaena sp. UHCC 0253 TaxID=2590019 RepID=UPI0014466D78|nr:hypothetical protein [Anabaena sp. UHCC 0253]MTJ53930.1 hypothetical protein [Anabaena sp. UHCC 0253]
MSSQKSTQNIFIGGNRSWKLAKIYVNRRTEFGAKLHTKTDQKREKEEREKAKIKTFNLYPLSFSTAKAQIFESEPSSMA